MNIDGGSVLVGDGGSIILNGTGGGAYTTNGNSNIGILINVGSITFLNCAGGSGLGGFNIGVEVGASLTTPGVLNFENCAGGSGGGSNHGVYVSSTLAASNISTNDVVGGPGFNNNVGFYVNGGTVGNANTGRLAIIAGSLGTGSSEIGILNAGTFQVGDTGTLTLTGTGGGVYNSAGANNYGVEIAGAFIAGVANNNAATINVTGIGGTGLGGSNHGVFVTTGTSVTFNSTSPNNTFTFMNCAAGSSSVTGASHGVEFNANFQMQGYLQFQNIIGGSGTQNNHGVQINTGVLVSGSSINGVDIVAGPGTGSDYGLHIQGTLGSTVTNHISMTAGSLGSGSNEIGVNVDGGTVLVGDGGSIILNGTGGGTYTTNGNSNIGILINVGSITAGTAAGSKLNSITLSGIGGTGTGGSSVTNGNIGVYYKGASSVTLNGTNPANSITFLNCSGGSGLGGFNIGVEIGASLTTPGVLNFENCAGGSGGGSNHGVYVSSTLAASNISTNDVVGGPGFNNNVGFYVNGGTVGNAGTGRLTIVAGSLGTGSTEVGILNAGTFQVGDAGTLTLTGTGGGVYNSAGANNYGVEIAGAFVAGVANNNAATINVTGIGGTGLGGSNHGVYVTAGTSVMFNSTSPNNTFTFVNCAAGSSSVTGASHGVEFNANFQMQGYLQFQNIIGGSGTQNNHGVQINTGVLVSGSSINGVDIVAGPGTGSDYGLHVQGTLGSTVTNHISMTAGSLGSGSNEIGIHLESGSVLVGDGGSIALNGTGGGAYTTNGNTNIGILINGGSITAGTAAGSKLNSITLTVIGGTGTGGSGVTNGNMGVYYKGASSLTLNGTNPANSITFLNCAGGSGLGGFNIGVGLASSLTTAGSLNFENCVGGSGGGNNYGVYVPATLAASNIATNDVVGGPGLNNNIGFYINGGSVGNASSGRLTITASSLGMGSNEVGVQIDSSGAVTVGDGGTMALIGTAGGLYNSAGTNNYGVYLNGAVLTAGVGGSGGLNTISVSGTGGYGSAGGHHGINIATALTLTLNGTNANNSVNFTNSVGGLGGNNNYGLNVGVSTTLTAGILNILNVTGGGSASSTNNYGVRVGSTLSAPTLKAMDVMGGPGSGSNIGFYVPGSTVGSNAVADLISIQAGSLGTGSGEVGIQVDSGGLIETALSGTIALEGIGGNGTGGACYGIYLTGASTQVAGASGAVSLTGIPGSGTTPGVYVDAGVKVSATAGNITFNTLVQNNVTLVGNNSTNSVSTTSGNILFAAPLSLVTNTVGIASSTTGNITFNGSVDGAAIGLTANATGGVLTFNQTVGGTAALGTINATGGSGIAINANMTTVGGGSGQMNFTGAVAVGNGVLLDTTNAGGTAAGGNMSFSSTVDSASSSVQNLTLNAGTAGTIGVTGAVGATHPLNALTITNTGGVTFSSSIAAASLLQQAGVSSSFLGAISTTGPGGINLTSSSITFASTISISGGGSFEANGPVFLSTIDSSIDTSAGGGYILFTSTVDSATITTKALTLSSGVGAVTFSGVVGGTHPLTSLTVNTASDVLFSANATTAAGGAVQVTHSGVLTIPSGVLITAPGGFTESAGTVSSNTSGSVALGGNITTSNTAIVFHTPVLLTTATPTLTSNGGAVTFNAGSTIRPVTGGMQGLTIAAGSTGTVTFNEAIGTPNLYLGALSIQSPNNIATTSSANMYASSITVSGGQGTATFNGSLNTNTIAGITIASASIALNNNVTTTAAGPLSVTGPVTIGGTGVVIDTSASGGGAISFSSTIDGGEPLTINAGAATITLNGNVGVTTTLGALTVTTTNISGLTLPLQTKATSVTINAPVTITGGATSVTSTTGNMSFSSTINGTQALTLTSAGTVSFGGNIGSTQPLISLTVNGPVILTGNTSVTTSPHSFITFSSTVDGDYNFTLSAGTTISFGGVVGGTTPIGALTMSGTGISLSSNIYTNNQTINLSALPVTLNSDVNINTQNAQTGASVGTGANITFGTITGAHNLSLNSGAQNIAFNGAVTGVSAITVARAGNVNVSASMSAASLTQTVGTGTTTIGATLTTSGAVNINTNIITASSSISASGAITLTHIGALTISATVTGASFTESGGGTVSLSSGIAVNASGPITFNSPINLVALFLLGLPDTSISGTVVTINNTIDGAESFAISGSTSVTFTGAATVGSATPPTGLSVTSAGSTINVGASQTVAGNISYDSLTVDITDSVVLAATAGTLTVSGAVTTNGNSLSGFASGNVTFQGAIDATGTSGGNILLSSSGAKVTANSINTSATGGSGVAGSILLQPTTTYTTSGSQVIPNGLIILQGSVTVSLTATSPAGFGNNGSILLSPNGRNTPQSIATIVSSAGGNNVSISGGSVMFGTNEAMTVFGSITIAATNYTALSDLVATDTITLPGTTPGCAATSDYWPSNFLVSRPPAPLLSDTGSIYFSPNVHALAGNNLIYCSGSVTPNCSTATPPVTRNIGVVASGLTPAQLTYTGQILNFDSESVPPPVPPSPPGPQPCPNCQPRSFYINQLLWADTELQDLLPPFWRSTHLIRIPKICPAWDPEECKELFTRFLAFIFENDVR
ncbi:MAG: S-layer family protein [Chlamydiia bacterium]|nr:S-layer family protein [Chlamydiia bacterium]